MVICGVSFLWFYQKRYEIEKKNNDEEDDAYQTINTPAISMEHEVDTLKFIHNVIVTALKKYP